MDITEIRSLHTDTSVMIERTLREAEAMDALADLGEERRSERSETIEVLSVESNEHGISGRVQGVSKAYTVSITITPKRSYRCSCPDSRQSGRVVGPCKHTLAFARHYRASLQTDLDRISTALVNCLF